MGEKLGGSASNPLTMILGGGGAAGGPAGLGKPTTFQPYSTGPGIQRGFSGGGQANPYGIVTPAEARQAERGGGGGGKKGPGGGLPGVGGGPLGVLMGGMMGGGGMPFDPFGSAMGSASGSGIQGATSNWLRGRADDLASNEATGVFGKAAQNMLGSGGSKK